MGLLESFFDPNTYGGQGGGLMDFLRTTQMQNQNYQPVQTAPWPDPAPAPTPAEQIGIGGYQMPRIGDMAQFTPQQPDPAALPPNAQPAQGQLPMQAPMPQESPGGFGAGLQGFLRNLHTGPIGAIAGGIGSAAGMQSPEVKQQNQTAQFLVSKGMDPAVAKAVVSDPALTRAVLPQIMGMGGQTDDIKEFERASKDPAFAKYMQQKRATQGEFSLTPQYGTDEKGNTVLIQPGKSGKAAIAELPPGVKVSSGTEKVDSGTHWTIYDKRTGTAIGVQPKDIEGKESAEERGKAKGLAQVALPNVIANAEQTLQTIKSIKEDPYRQRGTGLSSVFNAIPATGGYDFAQKLEQLKGKTFLEAFQQLKGGGAITEIEGKKAESAIARLSAGQSEGAFLEAVNELETIVTAGIERAKARAGQGGQPAQAAPAAPDRAAIEAELRRRGKL
jgi:hypothetical protein